MRYFVLLCWLAVFCSVSLLVLGGLWFQSNPPKEGWSVSVPSNEVLMTDSDYQHTRPVNKTNVPYALRQGYKRATPVEAEDWVREQAFTPRTGPLGFTPMGLVKFGAIGLFLGLLSTLLFGWLRSVLERRFTQGATPNLSASVEAIAARRLYRTDPRTFDERVKVVTGEVVNRSPPPALPPSTK